MGLFLTLLLVYFCSKTTYCSLLLREYTAPSAQEKTNSPEDDSMPTFGLSFMKRFGYLPSDGSGYDYAYTPLSLAEAVKKVQRFAGLPDTGELDDDTKKLFHAKRCGMKDLDEGASRKRRYVTKGGWNKKRITYKVINGTESMPKRRIEELMKKAFDVWAPYGQLEFVLDDGHKADIELMFARGYHGDVDSFDGPGNIVAHAFPPPHGGMHFDDEETWGENDYGEDDEITDFYTVAVHEIGHALGLGHSPVRTSIMYPYYQVPATSLDNDDIMGMYELYLKSPTPETLVEPFLDNTITSLAPKTTVAEDAPPNICSADYDTLAVMMRQIFVFKGHWMWKLRDQKLLDDAYPMKIHNFFTGLPNNVTFIQAIYERRDGNIVIFAGTDYWMTDGNYHFISQGTLSDYLLPPEVYEVTAAFRSNYNNKTYLFRSDRFYRFDEDSWSMDPRYPKPMSAWREVPSPIKSAAVWNGDTYFFKGPRFWRFDNKRILAHENYPLPTAQIWFGCPEGPEMMQYFTYP